MPKPSDSQHARRPLGPCPPGYQLKQVQGQWCCVSEDGETIPPNTRPKSRTVINPCPPGYELVKVEGRWMCRNTDNGHVQTPEAAKTNPRIPEGMTTEPPAPFEPPPE